MSSPEEMRKRKEDISAGVLPPEPCPSCRRGMMRNVRPGMYICDHCGKGIVEEIRSPESKDTKK